VQTVEWAGKDCINCQLPKCQILWVSAAQIPKLCIPCAGVLIAAFLGVSGMIITNGATVTLVESSFVNITIILSYPDSAVLSVNAVHRHSSNAQLQDTIVRLEQCTFSGNTAETVLKTYKGNVDYSAYSAFIFSDTLPHEVLQVTVGDDDLINKTEAPAKPLSTAPAGREGISRSSPWFQSVQKVRSQGASKANASLDDR
jgi:hypothetical protein